MSDVITSLNNNVSKIAQNDALKGVMGPIDTFLTNIQDNTSGELGDVGAVDLLAAGLRAALPGIGQQIAKDEAGAVKAAVDAEAAKAEAGNATGSTSSTQSASTAETANGANG